MAWWQQAAGWLLLYALWSVVSRGFHPTLELDLVVTAILLTAFAAAVYLNYLLLIPGLLRRKRPAAYAISLFAAMNMLTFLAIGTLRRAYAAFGYGTALGPYWPNYLVDLGGMALHLAGAALAMRLARRRVGAC